MAMHLKIYCQQMTFALESHMYCHLSSGINSTHLNINVCADADQCSIFTC